MHSTTPYRSDRTLRDQPVSSPAEIDALLAQALEALGEVVPYDLAAVLELEGDELAVRVARGPLASAAVRDHRLALAAAPGLAEALATRRPRAFLDEHHAGDEGDPYDGVLDLTQGHSCMVVPLHAGERDLGVITFDRAVCEPYPDEVVALAGIYGKVLGLALDLGRAAGWLARRLDASRERNRLLAIEARGPTPAIQRLRQARAPAMTRLLTQAEQVAVTDASVLITGETGTGKEVLARAVHDLSPRSGGPFVALNCAALPEGLIESELFGHVKGAFSGADAARLGRFQAADGGTLLLDELGELPPAAQGKLLRVLQEGTVTPVGADTRVRVDVRVLAATHRDLAAAVRAGDFREDLYYRLAVFPLALPPLRDRAEDIVPIAEGFLDDLHRRNGRGPWRLGADARGWLRTQAWPGNVRQLIHALERATILAGPGLLTRAELDGGGPSRMSPDPGRGARTGADTRDASRIDAGAGGRGPADAGAAGATRAPVGPGGVRRTPAEAGESARDGRGPPMTLREVEARHIRAVLTAARGKIYGPDGAAAALGLKPSTLQARLKKHAIVAADYRG